MDSRRWEMLPALPWQNMTTPLGESAGMNQPESLTPSGALKETDLYDKPIWSGVATILLVGK
ncbi:MAG: hypothetical protein DRP37_05545 [Thermodesulfobacteriota bacterium]|nr:MAG: hypothetical protein DRP37_05545 [Thermodesulfobacteriota bacterium]